MKTYNLFLVSILLIGTFGSLATASAVIQKGATVPVAINSTLSSASANVGTTFYAYQSSNSKGFPANTRFTGQVTSVTRASGSRPGRIGVRIVGAKLPNGTKVPVQGSISRSGKVVTTRTTRNSDVKNTAIGAGAGALIGQVVSKKPLMGGLIGAAAGYGYSRGHLRHTYHRVGKNVSIPKGTRVSAVVYQDVVVSKYKTAGYQNSKKLNKSGIL